MFELVLDSIFIQILNTLINFKQKYLLIRILSIFADLTQKIKKP